MPKPITPLAACDVFVTNEKNEVLLIKRADNGYWALPGGCQDLGETPKECSARECLEESGYSIEITDLLGVFSSQRYKYVHYPWKENEFCHLLFKAKLLGGHPKTSEETLQVGWFSEDKIPPLSDGHEVRIQLGFRSLRGEMKPYFE